jgi:hypothetical protein
VKLYGINGHVGLVVTLIFEGWARSGSSPSASAQYILASFRCENAGSLVLIIQDRVRPANTVRHLVEHAEHRAAVHLPWTTARTDAGTLRPPSEHDENTFGEPNRTVLGSRPQNTGVVMAKKSTRREWSKEDVRELKTLARQKTPVAKIAKSLKRTPGATQQKAFMLGVSLDSRA